MVKTNDPGIANKTRLMSIQVFILWNVGSYLQQYTSSIYCDVKRMSNDTSHMIKSTHSETRAAFPRTVNSTAI